ncbi:uncharacterized protein LOC135472377 [Liolophura sinensis]|uniref:uncharacterized protein LOC135472377 n=1 Tax=Liolophura sinensis TaxID=3198878 RepID=UPI003158F2D7
MIGKPVLQPVTSVWPVHRKQLLEEILAGSPHYGTVHRVWVARGHIFVSLSNGTQLFTFDVKPVGIGQDYQFGNLGCLDQSDVHPVLIDVLYSQKLNLAILVQKDGQVQLWKFLQQSYNWEKVEDAALCDASDSQVLSVCLLEEQCVVYWCERPVSPPNTNCTVYRRDLYSDNAFGPPIRVLENCPQCDLLPLNKGVFAAWSERVNVPGLVLSPDSNSISLYMDDKVYSPRSSTTVKPLDFSEVILPYLSKIKPKPSLPVSRLFDAANCCVVMVEADGGLCCISDKPEVKLGTNLKIQTDITRFKDVSCTFFMHKDCICQVTADTLIIHDYLSGEVVEHKLLETTSTDAQLSQLTTSPYFPTVMTTGGLKAVQISSSWKQASGNQDEDLVSYSQEIQRPRIDRSSNIETAEIVCKSFLQGSLPSDKFAVDGKCFQNPALVITMLDQLQEKVNSPRMTKERMSIVQNYTKVNTYKHTRYNESIVPYLNEYLSVEKTCLDVVNQNQKALVSNADSVGKDVLALIHPGSSLPASSRQAQLEVLAQRHPETVLLTLMQQLDIKSEDLSEEEMEKWSHVLASERSISSAYSGTFSLYEIITRLLFQQKPDQLVNFVHIAQVIHDKNVGVSAFIRKRQTFQFYERALSCFPKPESSRDVEGAVRAMAQLMLAMQTRSSLIKALQLLIRYEQWDPAVELLRQNANGTPAHQEVFYLLLTSIANFGVLGKYCVPVLQQIPSGTSLASILEMMNSQCKDSQPISSPQDIFCRGSADIEFGRVQGIFLSLLTKDKTEST